MLLTTEREPMVPTARAVRARLRALRRRHHRGSLSETLTDAYIVALVLATIGLSVVGGLGDYLGSNTVQHSDPAARFWLAVAAATLAAGLAWQGMRSVGPLLVSPATQTWAVSAPVDRRRWLLPRLRWLLVGAAGAGALLGAGAALSGAVGDPAQLGWWALAGAGGGTAATALGVLAQGSWPDPRWARRGGVALIGAGVTGALALVLGHFLGLPVPTPPIAGHTLVAAGGIAALPVAGLAVIAARRALSRVDRAALSAGGQVAHAAASAAVLLDPSLLTDLVAGRRWRRVGLVRRRPFRRAPRFLVLTQAELRRVRRHPSALAVWGILLLAMYAVGVALPSAAAVVQIVLAFLAGDRLAGGLRAISRSPGLRRSLGGRDRGLQLVHFVVPALGTTAWFLLTLPAVPLAVGWLDGVLLLGLLVAGYRFATRRPANYSGAVVDTPVGLVPVDILSQLLRGLALLMILVFIQALHL